MLVNGDFFHFRKAVKTAATSVQVTNAFFWFSSRHTNLIKVYFYSKCYKIGIHNFAKPLNSSGTRFNQYDDEYFGSAHIIFTATHEREQCCKKIQEQSQSVL